jgi:D-proline reductase (dithiol) PrdB
VCHQTVSLVARHLEANGIPTVVFGTARDIVEYAGVARFVFTDFPLGNPCGKPFDVAMQRHIVGMGLELLETATHPGTTVQVPYVWGEDTSWKKLIFTKERPFLTGEAYEHWMKAKEKYRELKESGKV